MRKNSNTVGDRINQFDNLQEQTVGNFNKLFPECPVKNMDDDLDLTIGSPLSNNRRELFVGLVSIEHKMFSDILYTMDRDEFNAEEKELDEIYGYPV